MHSFHVLALFLIPALVNTNGLPELQKRTNGTCGPMPLGKGPVPSPDGPDTFLNSAEISNAAKNAETPPGYKSAFTDLKASSSATNFMGYSTMDSYYTTGCATECNDQQGCTAINVFYERAPTMDVGPECPNPPSTTFIKCALWGGGVDELNANNAGYTDNAFMVVIAGSNGYVQGKDEGKNG